MNERKALRCLWDTVQDRDGPCQDRKVQAGGLSLHMCLWELGEGNTDKERGTGGTAVQGSTHIQRHTQDTHGCRLIGGRQKWIWRVLETHEAPM